MIPDCILHISFVYHDYPLIHLLLQDASNGLNAWGWFTRLERSWKDSRRTSEGRHHPTYLYVFVFPVVITLLDCSHSNPYKPLLFTSFSILLVWPSPDVWSFHERKTAYRSCVWYRHKTSCPPRCSRHSRHIEEARTRWQRWGCEWKNQEQAKENGGGDRRWPLHQVLDVQGVPEWSRGGDSRGGGSQVCAAQVVCGWFRNWSCSTCCNIFISK